ncbi:MAG: hypothetical protein ACI87E_001196 [Mariniblastus sp.]|jgi:hypothetical protein
MPNQLFMAARQELLLGITREWDVVNGSACQPESKLAMPALITHGQGPDLSVFARIERCLLLEFMERIAKHAV